MCLIKTTNYILMRILIAMADFELIEFNRPKIKKNRVNITNTRLTHFNEIFWTKDLHDQPGVFWLYAQKKKSLLLLSFASSITHTRCMSHWLSGIKDFFFFCRFFIDRSVIFSSSSLSFIFLLFVILWHSNIFSSFFLLLYGVSLRLCINEDIIK